VLSDTQYRQIQNETGFDRLHVEKALAYLKEIKDLCGLDHLLEFDTVRTIAQRCSARKDSMSRVCKLVWKEAQRLNFLNAVKQAGSRW